MAGKGSIQRLWRPQIAIALLTTAMGLPARFALLVATVGVMSLPPSHFRTAFRTAVALATAAAETGCEYGPARRKAANPKPKNSLAVDVHVRPKEIMPSWTG